MVVQNLQFHRDFAYFAMLACHPLMFRSATLFSICGYDIYYHLLDNNLIWCMHLIYLYKASFLWDSTTHPDNKINSVKIILLIVFDM